jgi:hypothetical protein
MFPFLILKKCDLLVFVTLETFQILKTSRKSRETFDLFHDFQELIKKTQSHETLRSWGSFVVKIIVFVYHILISHLPICFLKISQLIKNVIIKLGMI